MPGTIEIDRTVAEKLQATQIDSRAVICPPSNNTWYMSVDHTSTHKHIQSGPEKNCKKFNAPSFCNCMQ